MRKCLAKPSGSRLRGTSRLEPLLSEFYAQLENTIIIDQSFEWYWLTISLSTQCPENACGGVPRKRLTFCYRDGALADDCPEDQKPKTTDDCSPQACPADQISVLGECVGTEHGCCPDGTSVAGADFTGCPAFDRENFTTPCAQTEWGCCRDLVTPAFGPFEWVSRRLLNREIAEKRYIRRRSPTTPFK